MRCAWPQWSARLAGQLIHAGQCVRCRIGVDVADDRDTQQGRNSDRTSEREIRRIGSRITTSDVLSLRRNQVRSRYVDHS
ncbi:hypothetical protein Mvan_3658 [Mycolicibacterium vanbaalenii PYR-1]|uniref:Uncharacterized protein n=1 Tax=Mycolicibacterium vanbaalenii (strain DSM 7251 / JCM 13017 / BCRC 16820 / KCTC 9966 / NRRL B-24157 / PYR-1) TaxID=350058 RepID=A1TB96_MYCVP|nr:hypothetical protein Mvan_3658 [Mycolicibacterium vanbaalenii PYR-1]